MSLRLSLVFGLALVSTLGLAPGAAPAPAFDRSHAAFTEILRRHVAGGLVDYRALRADARLDAYLTTLASVEPGELARWPEADQIAFWIDAYNAFTLRLVLDHYPVKSIRSIGLLPGSALRKTFIRLPAAGSEPVSLDFIEHGTLRKRFREPRIHFALVCASRSCPPLREEAYRGADLDRQLEEATRAFLSDASRNRYDPATRTLRLSAIFKWFAEDFERASGSVIRFVAAHGSPALGGSLAAGSVDLAYEPYDWSLNERPVSGQAPAARR